jgi:hypothetical protein
MASKLTTLAKQKTAAQLQSLSRDSYNWLIKKVADLRGVSSIASQLSREQDRAVSDFKVGGLFYFYYDPKTKATLPYYDKFPLVLVLNISKDSFLGLNLHYLPLRYRLAFLDKLMDYAVLNDNNDVIRMRLSYDILTASRSVREFKPCLKKYYFNHVQSKILAVQPNEWEIAVHLPIQQFKKATAEEVWQDSIDTIRK